MPESEQADARERVIETASGTTSPDNAKSGPAAYVIFAVVVAVLLALASSVSSCASAASQLMVSGLAQDDAWDETYLDWAPDDETLGQDPFGTDGFEFYGGELTRA